MVMDEEDILTSAGCKWNGRDPELQYMILVHVTFISEVQVWMSEHDDTPFSDASPANHGWDVGY